VGVALMARRLNTNIGGTVGPQGASDVSQPTFQYFNRFLGEPGAFPMENRVTVVDMSPPYSPDAPFAVYNFEIDGAGDLSGRGTSGDKFRAIKSGSSWDNSNYASLYANTPPFYSTLDDFGGSWCDKPLTVVIQTENSGGVSEVQWVMTDDDTWGGIAINTQIDVSSYISMRIQWIGIGGSPPNYNTTAYWDLTTATLSAANTFILTLVPASTSHTLLINGTAFTAGTFHTNTVPGCSTFNDGVYPALAKTDVFNATDIVGMAWTRGAADADYWAAYDWST
jgi:hypothetical protein